MRPGRSARNMRAPEQRRKTCARPLSPLPHGCATPPSLSCSARRSSLAGLVVVGSGIFGVTAAIELRKRGHPVRLFDPGPLPHPLAASTDISKVVRLEYGADEVYTALAEQAIEGWKRWNRDFGETLYHETGLLLLRQSPLAPGTIEQDSFEVLSRRGHQPGLVDAAQVRTRYPAWNAARYSQGTYSRQGGFVES